MNMYPYSYGDIPERFEVEIKLKYFTITWRHIIIGTNLDIDKYSTLYYTLGSSSAPSKSSIVAIMLVISFRFIQPLSSTSHILKPQTDIRKSLNKITNKIPSGVMKIL